MSADPLSLRAIAEHAIRDHVHNGIACVACHGPLPHFASAFPVCDQRRLAEAVLRAYDLADVLMAGEASIRAVDVYGRLWADAIVAVAADLLAALAGGSPAERPFVSAECAHACSAWCGIGRCAFTDAAPVPAEPGRYYDGDCPRCWWGNADMDCGCHVRCQSAVCGKDSPSAAPAPAADETLAAAGGHVAPCQTCDLADGHPGPHWQRAEPSMTTHWDQREDR